MASGNSRSKKVLKKNCVEVFQGTKILLLESIAEGVLTPFACLCNLLKERKPY